MPVQIVARMVWIVSLVALIGSLAAFMKPAGPPSTAATFVRYTGPDGVISIEHPDNWKPIPSDSHGISSTVKFSPDDESQFTVTADLTTSLLADLGSQSGSMAELSAALNGAGRGLPANLRSTIIDRRKSPGEVAHDIQKASVEKKYTGYSEKPAVKMKIMDMDALSTDFTCTTKDFFSKDNRTGTRITAMMQDKSISVIYVCKENAVSELNPVFKKMVGTITIGQGGR